MTDQTLTNVQKRDLKEIIVQFNFKLEEFAVQDGASKELFDWRITTVRHTTSALYFSFDVDKDTSYICRYSPGVDKRHEKKSAQNWNEALNIFENWADNLREELVQPDPWAQYAEVMGVAPTADELNTPFTEEEKEKLQIGMQEVRDFVESVVGSGERQQKALAHVTYLLESSNRLGRKDWLLLAIGSLIGLAQTMAFSPEQTKGLFLILKSAITSVYRLIPYLP